MKRKAFVHLVFCGVILGDALRSHGPGESRAQTVSIQLEPVVSSGLANPLYVTHSRDGSNRLFIAEQPGRIRVLAPGAASPAVFLDIAGKVRFGGEQGLLGLAFHPDFRSNRRFFVNYTRRPDGATVVAEYRVSSSNPNVADLNETVLLVISQPFDNHNGGMIEFGPDGYLYISTGDGGAANDPDNRAQNIDDLLGKILRIDVDRPEGPDRPYSSPPDNPFSGPTPGRDEIFALGLRNPWRFSFDRATEQIHAGDVGQNAIEEIDIITRGGNYGWRVFEGTRCTNLGPAPCDPENYISPIHEYPQTGGRCSVIGGYVYRGARFTLPLGSYVFADYCTGEIFLLEGGTARLLLDTNENIASFGEDEDGEIYLAATGGSVWRIVNPSPPALTSLYFPRLAASDGSGAGADDSEFTGIAVANLDAADATVRMTAFDSSGSMIRGAGIINPVILTVGAGRQLPMVDIEIFGAGLSSGRPSGWILMESTASRLAGFFLMFNSSLSILDGADVSSGTLTSFVLPEVEDQGFTQIHLANPNPASAEISLELAGADGSARAGPLVRSLEPNGALIAQVSELFPGTEPGGQDYVRVAATRGVVPFEYFGRMTRYVQGLNGQNAAGGATMLYAPQYATSSDQYRTALSVINLDSTPGAVTFELIRDDGVPIGSTRQVNIGTRGKIHVTDQSFFLDAGNTLTQGYVRITSNGLRLAGSVIFGDPGRTTFSTALPLIATVEDSVIYSQLASDDLYFTGLAILNPNDAKVNVTIDLHDDSGARIAGKSETIPARQRRSRLLTQYFPELIGRSYRAGFFKVSADSGVASFALFGTHTLSVLSAIPPQRQP